MLTWIRPFGARLATLFHGARLDREFTQEFESHLEMLMEDHIRRGMTPAEVRRQAAIRPGAASDHSDLNQVGQAGEVVGIPRVQGEIAGSAVAAITSRRPVRLAAFLPDAATAA